LESVLGNRREQGGLAPKEVIGLPIRVKIPTPLQKLVDNQAEITAEGEDIMGLIDDMEVRYPGIKERICDEQGKVRRFVNIYLNGEDIRFMNTERTKLKSGDEVSIIPAIAGG
jgi:molybdopterin synthase sulfur carrier subunit